MATQWNPQGEKLDLSKINNGNEYVIGNSFPSISDLNNLVLGVQYSENNVTNAVNAATAAQISAEAAQRAAEEVVEKGGTVVTTDGVTQVSFETNTKAPINNPNFIGTLKQNDRPIGDFKFTNTAVHISAAQNGFNALYYLTYLGNKKWRCWGMGSTTTNSGWADVANGFSTEKIALGVGLPSGFFNTPQNAKCGTWFAHAHDGIPNSGTALGLIDVSRVYFSAHMGAAANSQNICFYHMYTTSGSTALWGDINIFSVNRVIQWDCILNAAMD